MRKVEPVGYLIALARNAPPKVTGEEKKTLEGKGG